VRAGDKTGLVASQTESEHHNKLNTIGPFLGLAAKSYAFLY
jgi:hypothetical protein